MSINPATLVRQPQAAASNAGSTRAPGFDYKSVILKQRQGIWQLRGIKEVEDEKYGDPKYGFKKLEFLFVHVVPGAEAAMEGTVDEQNAWRAKGHGKLLSLTVNPVVSPPGKNAKTGEATSPSNLYNILCVLLNDGEPLTDEQLGRGSDDAVKTWMKEYNSQVEPEHQLKDLPTARVYFEAFYRAEQLNKLAEEQPQVYATPVTKTSASGAKYNRLEKIDALVPPEQQAPKFEYYPIPVDPREAKDEVILCADTGAKIRGYENRKGDWVTARQAADHAIEKYGRPLCAKRIYELKREAGE